MIRVLSEFNGPSQRRVEEEISSRFEELRIRLEPGESYLWELPVSSELRSLAVRNDIVDPLGEQLCDLVINSGTGGEQNVYVPSGGGVFLPVENYVENVEFFNRFSEPGYVQMVLL